MTNTTQCRCEIALIRLKETNGDNTQLMCMCGRSYKTLGSYHRHIKHCWQYSPNDPCSKMFPIVDGDKGN